VATRLAAYGTVTRLFGTDRYKTAAAISAATFTSPTPTVYIATGADFPDGLAGVSAAAHNGAPLLLVTPDFIPAATATELTRLQPDNIIIVGGPNAVGTTVATRLAKIPILSTSVAGRLPRS
ncbi:MAG: cell wall-binding repeat-containing protein, partial [Actinobacteria bacterium]|nr:cell wall-binding repeat-containing protein [Actinomycetota bacterium]